MKSKQFKHLTIVALIFLSLASPVLAHEGENYLDHHGMMGGFYEGYGMGIFGWVFIALVIIVLILLITWLIKQLQNPKEKR